MTEEAAVQVTIDANVSTSRQRKKRKWDQPAEAVLAAAGGLAGLLPLSNPGALAGIGLPGMLPSLMAAYPTVPTAAASVQMSSTLPLVQQNAVAIVQKINQDLATKGLVPQVKIQDELIAREIMINDAEPSVRYKLTKRQTQEEIQAKTGAVVITRGKYKPPNAPVDLEKPLYLHISAGAHLKDTAERIRAVDQAAVLVDEMLKQGRIQAPGSCLTAQLPSGVGTPPSAVVFVDFEADSLPNLINRIRGPNDQYINHIMNETGATVVLKGGSCDSSCSEEIPQPLHLYISAENPKSVDDAKSLTENLLETIRCEFTGTRPPYFPPAVSYNLQQPLLQQAASNVESGSVHAHSLGQQSSILVPGVLQQSSVTASLTVDRLMSSKSYSAVPPPKQLLSGEESLSRNLSLSDISATAEGKVHTANLSTSTGTTVYPALASASGALSTYAGYPTLSVPYPTATGSTFSQQGYGIYPQASQGSQPYSSFSAYTGLYPQASPLQQVALALQRPPSSAVSVKSTSSTEAGSCARPQNSASEGQMEKQERQRRKFREAPVVEKLTSLDQVALLNVEEQLASNEFAATRQQIMPPPKAMPPPTPANMPPPPPKIKASMGPSSSKQASSAASTLMPPPPPVLVKTASPPQVDISVKGVKLVEYGEDDDDSDTTENQRKVEPVYANGKPFWAP